MRRGLSLALALALAAPGPAAVSAFASTVKPLPFGSAGAPVFADLALRSNDPVFVASFQADLIESVRVLPTLPVEQREAYLAGASGPAAKVLHLLSRHPEESAAALERLPALGLTGRTRTSLAAWLRAATDPKRTAPALDPAKLRIDRRVPSLRPNAYFGTYDGQDVVVKINADDNEVQVHAAAQSAPMPSQVRLLRLVAAGERGLPELAEVQGRERFNAHHATVWSQMARRAIVVERAPQDAFELSALPKRPIPRTAWRQVSEAVQAVHAAGASHGDLDGGKNILLSQAEPADRFYLIDWGRGRVRGDSLFTYDAHEDRTVVAEFGDRLGKAGLLEAIGGEDLAKGDDEEEPEPSPEPAARKWLKRAVLGGLLAASVAVPPLVSAGHYVASGPGNMIPLEWFSLTMHPAALVAIAVPAALVKLALSVWANRVAPLRMKGNASPLTKQLAVKPLWHPTIVGRLVAGSIVEELAWRVMAFSLFSGLLASVVPAALLYPAASTASAILFTLTHRYGPIPSRMLGAYWYQAAYHFTGSIWLGAVMHLAYNLAALIRARAGR